jgi:molybdopterin-guanine dinucleotide biosynthesis protein A
MNAIVLAGGRGSRMGGIDKAFLRMGGETFVDRIVRLLEPLVESVIVVTNDPEKYRGSRVRAVSDETAGRGPLMGLYSGLKASAAERSFVTTVDAPLLRPGLVERLRGLADGWDAVVPRSSFGLEPLCAIYSRRCIPAIERTLAEGRIVSFYPFIRVRILPPSAVEDVDPDGASFLNVNSPADYVAVQAAFRSGAASSERGPVLLDSREGRS